MSAPGSSRRRTAAAYKKGFKAGEQSALAKETDAPPTGVARTATGINLNFVAKALRTYADHVDGKPVYGDWFGCDLREAANMLEASTPPVKALAGAYKKCLDEVSLYNERWAIMQTKPLGTMRVDNEYKAIHEARRAFDKLAVDIATAALAATPAAKMGDGE